MLGARAMKWVFFLAAVSLLHCGFHQHAPGHAARESMTRVEFHPVPWKLCSNSVQVSSSISMGNYAGQAKPMDGKLGACDLDGPRGRITFHDIDYSRYGYSGRQGTRFSIEYDGARAVCGNDEGHPLSCAIGMNGREDSWHLELDAGCFYGALIGPTGSWALHTDKVKVLGHVVPGTEVSLVGDRGVAIFSERTGDSLDLFARQEEPIAPAQVIAVAAVHTLFDIEGSPVDCL